ncbi:MAG: hypothetical protein ACKN9T_04215 [Candidatus Methylumidiphilus sp.]
MVAVAHHRRTPGYWAKRHWTIAGMFFAHFKETPFVSFPTSPFPPDADVGFPIAIRINISFNFKHINNGTRHA